MVTILAISSSTRTVQHWLIHVWLIASYGHAGGIRGGHGEDGWFRWCYAPRPNNLLYSLASCLDLRPAVFTTVAPLLFRSLDPGGMRELKPRVINVGSPAGGV